MSQATRELLYSRLKKARSKLDCLRNEMSGA